MMTTAQSYWSVASRVPTEKAMWLAPPPMLFRPEMSAALGESEPTGVVEAAPVTRTSTNVATRDTVPRLEYGVSTLSSAPIPKTERTDLTGSSSRREGFTAERKSGIPAVPHPVEAMRTPFLLPSQEELEQEVPRKKRTATPIQPVPILRSEGVEKTQPSVREQLAMSVLPTIQSSPTASHGEQAWAEVVDTKPPQSTGRNKPDSRPQLRPHIVLTPPPMSAAPPERPAIIEQLPPSYPPDAPQTEQTSERVGVRIGSIVVHLEPPPQTVPQAPTPAPVKPSGPLARGFLGFGFHQS